MTAKKRRTVWLSDAEWSILQVIASGRDMNVSELVRELAYLKPTAPPSVMGGQAGRDAILRKINRTGSER